MCRLKNPTVVYMTTCSLSSCKTGVNNVHLLIILERGCSNRYRKYVAAHLFMDSPVFCLMKLCVVSSISFSSQAYLFVGIDLIAGGISKMIS